MSSRPQPAPAPRQSTDQKRAQLAWSAVKGEKNKEFVNLTKAAPALIMSSGLLQFVAFLGEKDKDQHGKLLRALFGGKTAREIIEALLKMDSGGYRQYTEEMLARLRWLRYFADVAAKED